MDGILLIPSDGFGPSVIDAAEKMLSMATNRVETVRADIGFEAYERTGELFPTDTITKAKSSGTSSMLQPWTTATTRVTPSAP